MGITVRRPHTSVHMVAFKSTSILFTTSKQLPHSQASLFVFNYDESPHNVAYVRYGSQPGKKGAQFRGLRYGFQPGKKGAQFRGLLYGSQPGKKGAQFRGLLYGSQPGKKGAQFHGLRYGSQPGKKGAQFRGLRYGSQPGKKGAQFHGLPTVHSHSKRLRPNITDVLAYNVHHKINFIHTCKMH